VTGAVERLLSGPASGVPGPAAARACRDVPLARCGLCAGWGSRSRRTAGPSRAKAAVQARDRAAMLASTWWRKAPEIARLAGHASTRTTEVAYRRKLPPVITTGAEIMDELFTGA
jgi:integrase